MEGILFALQTLDLQLRFDGIPVLVAHRGIDGPDHFDSGRFDTPQKPRAWLEKTTEFPRWQRNHLGETLAGHGRGELRSLCKSRFAA